MKVCFWLFSRFWEDVATRGDVGGMILVNWGLFIWLFGSLGICCEFSNDTWGDSLESTGVRTLSSKLESGVVSSSELSIESYGDLPGECIFFDGLLGEMVTCVLNETVLYFWNNISKYGVIGWNGSRWNLCANNTCPWEDKNSSLQLFFSNFDNGLFLMVEVSKMILDLLWNFGVKQQCLLLIYTPCQICDSIRYKQIFFLNYQILTRVDVQSWFVYLEWIC